MKGRVIMRVRWGRVGGRQGYGEGDGITGTIVTAILLIKSKGFFQILKEKFSSIGVPDVAKIGQHEQSISVY